MAKKLITVVALAAALTLSGCSTTNVASHTVKPTPAATKTASAAVSPAEESRLKKLAKLDGMRDGTKISASEYRDFYVSPTDASRLPYVYLDSGGQSRVYHAYTATGDSSHVRRPVPLPQAVIDDLGKRLDAIPEPTLDDGGAVSHKLVELARSIPDLYHPTFVVRAVFPADASENRRLNWLAVTAPNLSPSGDFVGSNDGFIGESDDRGRLLAGAEANAADLAHKGGTGIGAYPVIAQDR